MKIPLALAAIIMLGAVASAQADQLYVSPVDEPSGYPLYQVDPGTGAALSVLPAAAGYASGGISMNGELYYQSSYYDPSVGSVYDPADGTISTAYTLPAGNSGFIANGAVSSDAAGDRLFFSFGDSKVWEADVAAPGGTASLLYDADALGLQSIGGAAWSAATSSLFLGGGTATGGEIVRGTFADGNWSWSTFLTPAPSVAGLAIDDAGGKLYWIATSYSSARASPARCRAAPSTARASRQFSPASRK